MKKQFTPGNYFQVSNYIFELGLKPIPFMVYCYLKRCHNPERGAFPRKETIAEQCGIALSSVDNALKVLREKGVIAVEHRYKDGHQTSNLYKLRDIQQLWMNNYFIPAVEEEELEREEESERFVEEILADDPF